MYQGTDPDTFEFNVSVSGYRFGYYTAKITYVYLLDMDTCTSWPKSVTKQ